MDIDTVDAKKAQCHVIQFSIVFFFCLSFRLLIGPGKKKKTKFRVRNDGEEDERQLDDEVDEKV